MKKFFILGRILRMAACTAEESMIHILQLSEDFCNKTPNKGDPKVDEIFDMVQWNIMRFAVKDELERAGN